MNYARIKKHDIANGPGVRVSLYVSGCDFNCEGCFNPETWDFTYGGEFDSDTTYDVMEALSPWYIKGLSILGGEPLHPKNLGAVKRLIDYTKSIFDDTKTIWIYTGYRYEMLTAEQREAIRGVDVLVDGPFKESDKIIDLRFRGSTNQHIIDLKKTMGDGSVVLWDDPFVEIDMEE